MFNGPILEVLSNFGAFGVALAVVGGAAWSVYKKVIEPQQKDAKRIREQHIETLKEMNVQNEKFTLEHINIEKANLKVLQELTIGARTHNGKMAEEHKRIEAEVRRCEKEQK